jgi:L-ascorbate metabolism protein UlaG (beta-lactamase superfamily)
LGGAAVRIEWESGSLYVDPFALKPKKNRPADLVLVTNPRLGHLSPEDLALVVRDGTVVAGPVDALELLPTGARGLAPGDTLELPGVEVRAVPARNRDLSFFPASRGWLGYVIRAGGRTYSHAGATDRIPEMASIRADVAFLPVTGGYVMDHVEAASAADDVGATVRVPLLLVGDRYRRIEGFVTSEA